MPGSDHFVPGRRPSSISIRLTHVRSVSGLMPNWAEIRPIAPCLIAGSRRASITNLTARSRISSEYFLGAAITLTFRGMRASINPGRFNLSIT